MTTLTEAYAEGVDGTIIEIVDAETGAIVVRIMNAPEQSAHSHEVGIPDQIMESFSNTEIPARIVEAFNPIPRVGDAVKLVFASGRIAYAYPTAEQHPPTFKAQVTEISNNKTVTINKLGLQDGQGLAIIVVNVPVRVGDTVLCQWVPRGNKLVAESDDDAHGIVVLGVIP